MKIWSFLIIIHYVNDDIEQIIKKSNEMNCKIITTEKDYLRLEKYSNR